MCLILYQRLTRRMCNLKSEYAGIPDCKTFSEPNKKKRNEDNVYGSWWSMAIPIS